MAGSSMATIHEETEKMGVNNDQEPVVSMEQVSDSELGPREDELDENTDNEEAEDPSEMAVVVHSSTRQQSNSMMVAGPSDLAVLNPVFRAPFRPGVVESRFKMSEATIPNDFDWDSAKIVFTAMKVDIFGNAKFGDKWLFSAGLSIKSDAFGTMVRGMKFFAFLILEKTEN